MRNQKDYENAIGHIRNILLAIMDMYEQIDLNYNTRTFVTEEEISKKFGNFYKRDLCYLSLSPVLSAANETNLNAFLENLKTLTLETRLVLASLISKGISFLHFKIDRQKILDKHFVFVENAFFVIKEILKSVNAFLYEEFMFFNELAEMDRNELRSEFFRRKDEYISSESVTPLYVHYGKVRVTVDKSGKYIESSSRNFSYSKIRKRKRLMKTLDLVYEFASDQIIVYFDCLSFEI